MLLLLPSKSIFVPFRIVKSHLLVVRYSPACTRLLSQYKTMSKLVEEDVPSIDQFMTQYRVGDIKPNYHA